MRHLRGHGGGDNSSHRTSPTEFDQIASPVSTLARAFWQVVIFMFGHIAAFKLIIARANMGTRGRMG